MVATNIPTDKILLKQPDKLVKIYVNASGYNLIAYQLWSKKIKIDTGKATLVKGTTYQIKTNRLVDNIQKQLLSNTSIIEIIDKLVTIEMGKMVYKKIPVQLNSAISYENGYKIKGTIKLLPDSVFIFAPTIK